MQCQWLPVKVASTHYRIFVVKHDRVVGYCVYFHFHHIRHSVYHIPCSAMHLWHTAEGIRVLHLFLLYLLQPASL